MIASDGSEATSDGKAAWIAAADDNSRSPAFWNSTSSAICVRPRWLLEPRIVCV